MAFIYDPSDLTCGAAGWAGCRITSTETTPGSSSQLHPAQITKASAELWLKGGGKTLAMQGKENSCIPCGTSKKPPSWILIMKHPGRSLAKGMNAVHVHAYTHTQSLGKQPHICDFSGAMLHLTGLRIGRQYLILVSGSYKRLWF